MRSPDVSVVIAAYNAMPYVTECLTSVLDQSIDPAAVEIIVVDDGSTDGTAAELDGFAARHPRMIVRHQANSGSPAGPRNLGIALASGRFVFFVDADDKLAPQALARLVAMADKNDSDIVLGKLAGIGGRRVGRAMFGASQPDADLFTTKVYWTLHALKLFRLDLLRRHDIRFAEVIGSGEDQPFTALAYLRAKKISVLADYVCYYHRRREDGGNLTQRHRDPLQRLAMQQYVTSLVAANVPPGRDRDHLMRRHFQNDINKCFHQLFATADPETRTAAIALGTSLVDAWYTDAIAARLPVLPRLRYHCMKTRKTDELRAIIEFAIGGGVPRYVYEGARVYAAYPYFRDPAVGIPDAQYDAGNDIEVVHALTDVAWHGDVLRVTGYAYLPDASPADTAVEMLVRNRKTGAEIHPTVRTIAVPGTATLGTATLGTASLGAAAPGTAALATAGCGATGFEADVDVAGGADGSAALRRGVWDFYLRVRVHDLVRETRVGGVAGQQPPAPRHIPRRTAQPGRQPISAVPYHTEKAGNLSLDIDRRPRQPATLSRKLRARAIAKLKRVRRRGRRLLGRIRLLRTMRAGAMRLGASRRLRVADRVQRKQRDM